MKEHKYTLEQLKDFCNEHTPYEVKERTREIILNLLQADSFNSMDTFSKVVFAKYLFQIEDMLLCAFNDLNSETNGK